MELTKEERNKALTPIRKKHHAFINKSVIQFLNDNNDYDLEIEYRDKMIIGEYVKSRLHYKGHFLCVLDFFFEKGKEVLL